MLVVQLKWYNKHLQGLDDLNVEDDTKDLINREIRSFRNLHKVFIILDFFLYLLNESMFTKNEYEKSTEPCFYMLSQLLHIFLGYFGFPVLSTNTYIYLMVFCHTH